jgi:hypothetical protein
VSRDRGQLVLLAAVVVAVALVPMAVAYAQLGYDADHSADAPDVTLDDVRRSLDAAFTTAALDVDGTADASDATAAASAVREDLRAAVRRLERDVAATDRGLVVSYNATAAAAWADERCPGGAGREFGDCRVESGLVVQSRAGETTVLAAGFDLSVVGPGERTNATVLVEAV